MTSQPGNLGVAISNAGCGSVASVSNNQTISAANSSKSNTKMSIDHQATLDKGLKMKIKRTKPGTKSSEAKHEIVKATEQQQTATAIGVVVENLPTDETLSGSSLPNLCSQNNESSACSSNTLINTIPTGAKKVLCNNSNQTNINVPPSTNPNSQVPTSSNTCNSTSLGTKRGSSGHRRDKTKDKSNNSCRAGIDNKVAQCNDKELQDKSVCLCSVGDSITSSCSSVSCIRKNEISLVQTLSNSRSNVNSSTIPPGIFIPSADMHSNVVPAANMLDVSSTVERSEIIPHSLISNSAANAPVAPSKESNNSANVKISSHIAAQLAAAVTNFTNISTLPILDTKKTTSNVSHISKQNSSGNISTTVHHTTSGACSNTKTNITRDPGSVHKLPSNISTIPCNEADESLQSPPHKRAKTNDCNIIKKDMIDVCVGTSIGTITEPDCLGPCEPGTSVTLEGIVWHETEGGVLVVNVTWRGKTYVGTLLDCTRHDWAPPR